MLFVYPAVFHEENGSFWADFPDLEGCQSVGDTLEETMQNIQEALELYISVLLDENTKLPVASNVRNIKTDENSFVTLVSCNLGNYLKKSKAVKKTLTIPQWLDEQATKENVNFSQTLQKALIEQLHLN